MINLQQYLPQEYDFPSQFVLMDFSGKIVQSCNSIFDTSIFQSKSIVNEIPFLESIFNIIKSHIPGTPEILFKKVESPFYLLRGIYDFTFSSLIVENQSLILWTIFDKTSFYDGLIKNQQQRNESEIRKQLKSTNLSIRNLITELQYSYFLLIDNSGSLKNAVE